jgi:hypothetical protein
MTRENKDSPAVIRDVMEDKSGTKVLGSDMNESKERKYYLIK